SSFSAGNYAIDETFTRLAPVQTQNPSPHHHHSSNREGRWGSLLLPKVTMNGFASGDADDAFANVPVLPSENTTQTNSHCH
uniref:hypothetical protein n=1 Tax=Thiolapillus sp. TaxID=2017437 RepID=UPI0025FEE31C